MGLREWGKAALVSLALAGCEPKDQPTQNPTGTISSSEGEAIEKLLNGCHDQALAFAARDNLFSPNPVLPNPCEDVEAASNVLAACPPLIVLEHLEGATSDPERGKISEMVLAVLKSGIHLKREVERAKKILPTCIPDEELPGYEKLLQLKVDPQKRGPQNTPSSFPKVSPPKNGVPLNRENSSSIHG